MNAPLPSNERERLRALRRYAILDTRAEAGFDRVTRLVARLLKVPISLVSLIDEDRQWFKSTYGLESRETNRDIAFCAHAILHEEMLVIPDPTRDERFHDNPLVTGNPRIRFYAGMPLKSSDGFNLGTLCAIDTQPRELSVEEREILRDLAAIITDELELRLAVRERSQQAAAIFHLNSGVIVTDPNVPDNPIVFGNPGFWAMTGYTPDEVVGHNCRFLQGPETDQATVAAIRDAIAGRRSISCELLNYRKDGTPFWNELTISPVYDAGGQLINFVGLQTDVTERKRTSNQLQESYDKLKNLEALRDNLTGMIVHDLRSPLTSVIGFLDLLQTDAAKKLGAEEMRFIEIASSGAATLQEMITSLLDVTRLEAGEMPLDFQQADLREIITAATTPFLSLMKGRSLEHDLPADPVGVRCDIDLLKRVVTNLVSNAVKFTPKRGEVRVAVVVAEGRAKVSVTDTGSGIPAEYHAKIFEKFGQVDTRRHRHSTGLGLTLCKLAVEAHGGAIGVESVEGKGATFWFTLHCHEHDDAA